MAKKSNVVRADFTGVETASVIPEGEYICTVDTATLEEGEKGEYIRWEMKITDGKYAGKKVFNNTSLTKQSLWSTKRFLEALGINVPNGTYDIDLEEITGSSIGVVVEHETYKGRTQSRVIDVFPAEGSESETEEKEEEETSDIPTDEEISEMGKADLKEVIEKHSLDVDPTGTTSTLRRAVTKAVAGLRGGKKEKKAEPKVTYASDDLGNMSEEELEELVEKHELDVNLDKLSNLRKKRNAVIEALEEANLLTDA